MLNNEILHQTKNLQEQINSLSVELETERKERRIERLSNEIEIQKRELTAKALALVENKEMLNEVYNELNLSKNQLKKTEKLKISKLSKKIKTKIDTQTEWEEMLSLFNQIHSGFIERLNQKLPKLTISEQKVCTFLRMKMSSKDIASLMHVSPKTIRNYRSNIRNKARLSRKDNIIKFIEII